MTILVIIDTNDSRVLENLGAVNIRKFNLYFVQNGVVGVGPKHFFSVYNIPQCFFMTTFLYDIFANMYVFIFLCSVTIQFLELRVASS